MPAEGGRAYRHRAPHIAWHRAAARGAGVAQEGPSRGRLQHDPAWRRPKSGNRPCPSLFGRAETLQHVLFEDLDLLLRVLERPLAEFEQLGATLVRSERLLERHLPGFHACYDFFQLSKGRFESRLVRTLAGG